MLKTLGLSVIRDFVFFLKREKDFFEKSNTDRENLIISHFLDKYPKIFKEYLLKISEKEFLEDLLNLVKFLKNKEVKADNNFLNSLASYIAYDLTFIVDRLSNDFFFADLNERQKVLQEFFDTKSYFSIAVMEMIAFSTYQELNEKIYKSLNLLKESALVVIQSPLEVNSETKSVIREYFLEKKPYSQTEFRINKEIIGGIRIFCDGYVADCSWMSKIQNLKFKI